jgi:hypothetical protein
VHLAHNASLHCCTALHIAAEFVQAYLLYPTTVTPWLQRLPEPHLLVIHRLYRAQRQRIMHSMCRITAAACTLLLWVMPQAARGRQPPITESATRCDVAALDVFAGELSEASFVLCRAAVLLLAVLGLYASH